MAPLDRVFQRSPAFRTIDLCRNDLVFFVKKIPFLHAEPSSVSPPQILVVLYKHACSKVATEGGYYISQEIVRHVECVFQTSDLRPPTSDHDVMRSEVCGRR